MSAVAPEWRRHTVVLPAIGKRLHAARVRAGISQRELSRGTVYTAAYVSRIEGGERTPSMRALIAFASRLPGVTGLQLLTGRRNATCPLCRRSS